MIRVLISGLSVAGAVDYCVAGAAGDSTDAIPACVCAFDDWCCGVEWDAQCVSKGKSDYCGGVCEAAACPQGPEPPLCVVSEVQSPRDLTPGAQGSRSAKAAVLTVDQTEKLELTNVHFHYGAEHKSTEYSDSTIADAWDAAQAGHDDHRRLSGDDHSNPRPGFMCDASSVSEEDLMPYEFQYCGGNMNVGDSYEVHYVHSSAGGGDIEDGLGAAVRARGQLNPMVAVQAMVFLIVNDDSAAHIDMDLVHGWGHSEHPDAVMYAGSTTGTSWDNEVCSPWTVTWHVDRACHQITAASFDNMCKDLIEMGLDKDVYAHNSRTIVDSAFVVPADEVHPIM